MKLAKEYLSILQFLLYKAQKRQKIKKIFKFQNIFYKSKSLVLLLLRTKSLNDFERNKLKHFLSEPFFQRILKISILKKETQIYYFFNSKFKLNKKLIYFIENCNAASSSFAPLCYCFLLDLKKKQIFSMNVVFFYDSSKLAYFSFLNYFFNLNLLRICQYEFLNIIYGAPPIFLLLLQKNNMLLFDISVKKNNILKKNHINFFFFFGGLSHYPLFNYRRFYSFYYHNYFLDCEKIEFQYFIYINLLCNKKYKFFFYNKKKINKIKYHRTEPCKLVKNSFLKFNNKILKNRFFCYYSIICHFPYLRQNLFYFSIKLLNNFYFDNITKRLLEKLNNIQRQILFFICEPIWEASFEISSYSNRRGRSIYDAVEFLRLNLKQQPMFLFKTYVTFFNRFFYKTKKYKEYLKSSPTNKLIFFSNKRKMEDTFLIFFCFFENILFHGVQKKYQYYYLITKQQIFLYQIIKIFRQNTKNSIDFYKIFYNNKFLILSIQNKISSKLDKNIFSNNIFLLNIKKIKAYIISYIYFILQYYKNNYFYKWKNKIYNFSQFFVSKLKSKNFLIKNFLIFSLNDFFFNKIKGLKQRLFCLELKKQRFSFDLQKMFLAFHSIKSEVPQKEGVSFSIILKDSNLFVSKNTFLFFIKNKKVFFDTNMLIKWGNKKFCFYKKIKKNNKILLKKFQYYINKINNINNIYVFYTKRFPSQSNYKILLEINLFFLYGYYSQFVRFSSFDNIFLNFTLFIKNIFFFSKQIYSQNFFFIMFYFNFYGQIFSFFKYRLQSPKVYVIYLLEKNDIHFVLNSFIKYDNIILFFNYNYTFLKSFKTIFKKSLIFIRLFLCFYLKHKNNLFTWEQNKLHSKSLIFYYNDFLVTYLKLFFYSITLNKFSNKKSFLNSKNEIKKEIIHHKYYTFNSLWSIQFFIIKKKHTFLFYKKHLNGFYFYNFFMFHTNKNYKKLFSNCLFFWQFYYIHMLVKCEYIKSFSQYYQVYNFLNKKGLKQKQIRKILQFYFYQSFFFKDLHPILWKFNKFIKIVINFLFSYRSKFSSFFLFKLIFSKIFKNESRRSPLEDEEILTKFIFYKTLIQQQKVNICYYFSIKPSKNNIQKHLFEISNIVKKNTNKNQEYIIFQLSTIIKNWCLYYKILTPTILYKYIDYLTLQILWKWACRRHSKKSKKWIKVKYFYKFNFIYNKFIKNNYQTEKARRIKKRPKKIIIFACQLKYSFTTNKQNSKHILLKQSSALSINKTWKKTFLCLPNHTDIVLVKHKLIQNDRSPFDIDFVYWITRHFYY